MVSHEQATQLALKAMDHYPHVFEGARRSSSVAEPSEIAERVKQFIDVLVESGPGRAAVVGKRQ